VREQGTEIRDQGKTWGAFVKQIKETFPGISGTELQEKIVLFRELKRIRSIGS